jgi:hypothetical protein
MASSCWVPKGHTNLRQCLPDGGDEDAAEAVTDVADPQPIALTAADVETVSQLQGEALFRLLEQHGAAAVDARTLHVVGAALAHDPILWRPASVTRGSAEAVRAPRHWVPVALRLARACVGGRDNGQIAVAAAHALTTAVTPYTSVCASSDEVGELRATIVRLQAEAPPAAALPFTWLVQRVDMLDRYA